MVQIVSRKNLLAVAFATTIKVSNALQLNKINHFTGPVDKWPEQRLKVKHDPVSEENKEISNAEETQTNADQETQTQSEDTQPKSPTLRGTLQQIAPTENDVETMELKEENDVESEVSEDTQDTPKTSKTVPTQNTQDSNESVQTVDSKASVWTVRSFQSSQKESLQSQQSDFQKTAPSQGDFETICSQIEPFLDQQILLTGYFTIQGSAWSYFAKVQKFMLALLLVVKCQMQQRLLQKQCCASCLSEEEKKEKVSQWDVQSALILMLVAGFQCFDQFDTQFDCGQSPDNKGWIYLGLAGQYLQLRGTWSLNEARQSQKFEDCCSIGSKQGITEFFGLTAVILIIFLKNQIDLLQVGYIHQSVGGSQQAWSTGLLVAELQVFAFQVFVCIWVCTITLHKADFKKGGCVGNSFEDVVWCRKPKITTASDGKNQTVSEQAPLVQVVQAKQDEHQDQQDKQDQQDQQ